MADGDEDAFDRDAAFRAALDVLDPDLGDPQWVVLALDAVQHRIPDHFDLGVPKEAFLEDLLGPEGVAPVDEGDLRGVTGEIHRFLDRRVAAADDADRQAAEKEAVAGGAGRHPESLEPLLAFQSQPAGAGAGGDDQGIGGVAVAGIAEQGERSARKIGRDDGVGAGGGADVLGLLPHLLHQPRSLDDLGEAGVVLDIGGDRHLTAWLKAPDHVGLETGARGVDRRGKPGGTGTEDQDFTVEVFAHGSGVSKRCRGVLNAAREFYTLKPDS